MLLELLQNDTYLNYIIIGLGILWAFIFLRIFLTKKAKKATASFQAEYEKILNSDEYKVKRKNEA
jgi:hypothetical protein